MKLGVKIFTGLMCVVSMLAGACLSAQEPYVTETDMLTWFDSTLPADTYVGVHAERRDDATGLWTPATQVYQPFKSVVEPALHQIYWRKDAINYDFYGELFTYDDENIYLLSETFPKWPGDPDWDTRYDRFRLFVNRANDPLDYGVGRIVAPRTITADWRISQHFNTYLVNSMEECNTRTADLFQDNFYDNDVFITVERPFNTVYDGELAGWEADEEFKTFDEAVIINQQMANNVGRERFIFARKGETYYGLVRWDGAKYVGGEWEITSRATGLKLRTKAPEFVFDGFYQRARESIDIAPFTGDRNAVRHMDGFE